MRGIDRERRGVRDWFDRWFSVVLALAVGLALTGALATAEALGLGPGSRVLAAGGAIVVAMGAVHGMGLWLGLAHWRPSCWHPRRFPGSRPAPAGEAENPGGNGKAAGP